jgi:hypothetical protein
LRKGKGKQEALGLTKFVCYNREFVVFEFVSVVYVDFGIEKKGKNLFVKTGSLL